MSLETKSENTNPEAKDHMDQITSQAHLIDNNRELDVSPVFPDSPQDSIPSFANRFNSIPVLNSSQSE